MRDRCVACANPMHDSRVAGSMAVGDNFYFFVIPFLLLIVILLLLLWIIIIIIFVGRVELYRGKYVFSYSTTDVF